MSSNTIWKYLTIKVHTRQEVTLVDALNQKILELDCSGFRSSAARARQSLLTISSVSRIFAASSSEYINIVYAQDNLGK